MRVRVYKRDDGAVDVLVEASLGKGRPPILLKSVAVKDLVGKVLPVVNAMRKPKGELLGLDQ